MPFKVAISNAHDFHPGHLGLCGKPVPSRGPAKSAARLFLSKAEAQGALEAYALAHKFSGCAWVSKVSGKAGR